MNCPKCKDLKLRKKEFSSPFSCDNCGGLWLDFEKIPSFFETITLTDTTQPAKNVNDGKAGFCPAGHGLLTRAKVEDSENPFYLEKCSTCGGIWFDNGEWLRIINNNLAHHINDIWCSSWQAQQRKRKNRNTYLEMNRAVLGEELFTKVLELSLLLKGHPERGRALALLQQEMK